MSLNITVATRRCIYQSADFRLVDWTTGELTDFETQKIVLAQKYRWTATVCFAGVGRTHRVNVGSWLAVLVNAIQAEEPFEQLLDELLTADDWLSEVETPKRKHSFSVGAFVGSRPVFALVSNFEAIGKPPLSIARARLSVSTLRPVIPTTFVSGVVGALSRADRRRLSSLAGRDPEPQRMCEELASLNRSASERSQLVSPECFTTYVLLTGEGGGAAHGLGSRPFMPEFAFPPQVREGITQLLDKQFGPGRYQLRQMASARSEPTEEYHQVQLREKPNDPSTHANYGAFLKDVKGDSAGAERAYRKALELDGNHANALGNLANVMWEQGDVTAAEELYRKALLSKPANEKVTYNFSRLLNSTRNHPAAALAVLRAGIDENPSSGRLHLLHGQLSLSQGNAAEALESFKRARETGADQARVESDFACALHVVGAPVGDCLAAYMVAIALNPQNAHLKLNLAQLLFLRGDDLEANERLQEALQIGLDDSAELEALFYQLAHTSAEPASVLLAVSERLSRGARLRWDVLPNIAKIKAECAGKAILLETVRKIMAGEQDPAGLADVVSQWPASRNA